MNPLTQSLPLNHLLSHTQQNQVESHADGGGGAVGVLAEGTVGRMAAEPVRAGEAADIPELERLGA